LGDSNDPLRLCGWCRGETAEAAYAKADAEADAYDAAYTAAAAYAAAEISALEERVRSFEESLALCLGAESPLPPLAKEVVRGFFVSTAAKKEVIVLENSEMPWGDG
jgi:hypothetical protein